MLPRTLLLQGILQSLLEKLLNMLQIKNFAITFLLLLCMIFSIFLYQGITNFVPVSMDYNIPIASTIISGDFLTIHSDTNPYIYFPGSSHIILAFFILFGLPNLFGLFSWVVLFIVCIKLGKSFGLSKYMSIVFSASFCTTMSVVRTIGDQSIDKWLCSWFVIALLLFERPKKSWKFTLLIGLALGMLVGTKYSGPLFFVALLLVYGKRLFQFLSPLRFFVASFLFTLTGLFWYIRNFFLEGNPYYPANLPFFKGFPHFTQQDWMLGKVIVTYPQGNIDLINAFLSEYLIWAFSGFILLVYIIFTFQKKQIIDSRIIRLMWLSITTGIASLFLPITTPYKIELFHIISDMRYIYIFVVILMLAVFLIAQQYKKENLIATVALVNAIPVFTYIPYLPKIYIISFIFALFVYMKRPHFFEKL